MVVCGRGVPWVVVDGGGFILVVMGGSGYLLGGGWFIVGSGRFILGDDA